MMTDIFTATLYKATYVSSYSTSLRDLDNESVDGGALTYNTWIKEVKFDSNVSKIIEEMRNLEINFKETLSQMNGNQLEYYS